MFILLLYVNLKQEKQAHRGVLTSLGGAASGRVIPGSIPNPEVKPPSADDTAGYVCGNVGQCHFETFTSFIIPILLTSDFFLLFYCCL